MGGEMKRAKLSWSGEDGSLDGSVCYGAMV